MALKGAERRNTNVTTAYLASNYLDGTSILLSKGKAKDWSKSPVEVKIHHEGSLSEYLKTSDTVWHIVSTFIDPQISLNYYLSSEEAIAAAKAAGAEDAGDWCCYSTHIDNEVYEPTRLPLRTTLARNQKGLYCHLNLHPEEDGYHARGKIFFPDRACADSLCEGPAIIKSVNDKGNYGFFVGEMVQHKAPSDEQVSEYIIQHGQYDCMVRFMEGKLGSYVQLDGDDCFVEAQDGTMSYSSDMQLYGEECSTCTEEILGVDLICQGYQGCNFKELSAQFVRFNFEPNRATWSTKFISKLFDEAIKCRFIALKTTNNVDFVEVDKEQLMYALDQFSREEMSKIIATVNKINASANKAIGAKLRNGKVRLT